MSHIVKIIQSLQNYRKAGKATKIEIVDAEISLRLNFSDEYKEYLEEFGAVSAYGMELTGLISVEYRNVVNVTKEEWELNLKIPHTMYVVENTFVDGIVIWQDTNGLIYQSTSGTEAKQIANSLAEYLQKRMK